MLADVGRMQVGTVTGSDVGEPMIVPVWWSGLDAAGEDRMSV